MSLKVCCEAFNSRPHGSSLPAAYRTGLQALAAKSHDSNLAAATTDSQEKWQRIMQATQGKAQLSC
jgi:hypothetical protein